MDKFKNTKEQKQLLEELERMRKEKEKRTRRQDAQRWKPIETPIALEEALSRLSATALSNIRTRLQVAGASGLRKNELCAVLADYIRRNYRTAIETLDEQRVEVLRKTAKQGGVAALDLMPFQADAFLHNGLLFPGTVGDRRVYVMPEEAKAHWQTVNQAELRRLARRNGDWIRLTQGMLYYYGVLRWDDCLAILKRFEAGDETEMRRVLERSGGGYADFEVGRDYVSHLDVEDPEQLLAEQNLRAAVPFYPFTRKQLLEAGEPEYVDRTPAFRAMVDFLLANYEISREEAEDEVDQLVFGIQLGDRMSAAFENLQEVFEFPDERFVEQLAQLYTNLNNNTRQWALKGHAPTELSAWRRKDEGGGAGAEAGTSLDSGSGKVYSFPTGTKIGRNDPCPCGSGKKFKKCCGA